MTAFNVRRACSSPVRNHILQLRGIDTYEEFVTRHRVAMEKGSASSA